MGSKQFTDTVLMIRPVRFQFSHSTAASNSFQEKSDQLSDEQVQYIASLEFDNFVSKLRGEGIEVLVYQDEQDPFTPDSIFPNNWISTNSNGLLCTYPMASSIRAAERRQDIIDDLVRKYGYRLNRDLEGLEDEAIYLEGTGSLVIDHPSKTAFAALSDRTHISAIEDWCTITGYDTVTFRAFGRGGEPIYHTNVMMCIADHFAMIGSDCIHHEDRNRVINALRSRGKEIISLNNHQVFNCFAGNMLQLGNKIGEKFLVMSARAYESLNNAQIKQIEKKLKNRIIHSPINTIEKIGGGSARCMIAEIFQPEKS